MRTISPNATFSYTLKADRDLPADDPNRSVFELRVLTRGERARLEDLGSIDPVAGVYKLNGGAMKEAAVQAGLIGWERVCDAHGTPIPFARVSKTLNVLGRQCSPVEPKLLDLLPYDAFTELADAIFNGAFLSVEEGKG